MVSIGCTQKSPKAVAKAPQRHSSTAFNSMEDFLSRLPESFNATIGVSTSGSLLPIAASLVE